MNQRPIVNVLEARLRNIQKLLAKVTVHFDLNTIQEFRIETKKLRAFLRLSSIEYDYYNQLRISKKLKNIYGYLGIIRNIQVQQEKINSCEAPLRQALGFYMKTLMIEEEYWIKEARQCLSEELFYSVDEENTRQRLPNTLSPDCLKKFVQYKAEELKEALAGNLKDTSLHTARKVLKDVLYNWPFLDRESICELPVSLLVQRDVESLTQILGKFRDICISINLLESAMKDHGRTEKENAALEEVKKQWTEKKLQLRQNIHAILMQMELIPHTMLAKKSVSYVATSIG